MIVAILLGVLTLVVLVGAFLASKRWHVGHVLAVVGFYFASVAFLYLGAQTLKARNGLQKQVTTSEQRLVTTTDAVDALAVGTRVPALVNRLRRDLEVPDGADEIESVERLAHNLRLTSRARGRVWRGAVPAGEVDQTNGSVRVGFPAAAPPAQQTDEFGDPIEAEPAEPAAAGRLDLESNAVVYLFEERAQQRSPEYLGEFLVKEVDAEGRTALLEPLGQLDLDTYAANRLLGSAGPWSVYETMPADSRDLFAELDEEQLRQLLPEAAIEEYLRDGTPAEPDDNPERHVDLDADGQPIPAESDIEPVSQEYRRLVRDYAFLLADSDQAFAELVALVKGATVEVARLEAALASAERLGEFRKQQISMLTSDLRSVEKDRAAINEHLEQLNRQLGQAEQLLTALLEENAALASQIASARGPMTPVVSPALDIDAL